MLEHHNLLKWTALVGISVLSIILNVSQVSFGTTIGASMPREDKLRLINLNAKNLYEHYCVHCHGKEGKGDGTSFPYEMEPKPRDFTDTKYMAKLKDAVIQQVIIGGTASIDKSNLCPAWGETFNEKQVKELVAYVRTFSAPPPKEEEPGEAAAPAVEETVEEGVGVKPFIVWPILTLLTAFFVWIALLEWREHVFFLKGRS